MDALNVSRLKKVLARTAVSTLLLSGLARAGDWPMYRHDVLGGSDPGEPLTLDSARGLQGNWTAFTKGWNYANPIVAGGVVYLTSGDDNLYAFDVATGARRWSRDSAALGPFHCIASTSKGPIGAPAVVGSKVFMPGADGVVYAYDASRDGATLWSTKIADVQKLGEFLWTSAFPLGGKVYFGVSSLHDCLLVPGRMVALDQETGAVTGTWWADDNHGSGGGVWTQPAYDARTGRFFMTTGTIAPGLLPAQQPNADAFVAIDPVAMSTTDRFSPVAGLFINDLDFGASPTLFDAAGRHLIAAANKNGWVYALDRDNLAGGVVWSYQICGSGASPDQGESSIVSAPYANGLLFVGGARTVDSFPGAVAALDAATGKEKWLIHPAGFVLGAMTTVGDVLFFGATDPNTYAGTFYAVAQATGEVLYTLKGAPFFGQPTFANGQLFVGDLGGAFYSLLPGGSQVAQDFALSISPPSQELGAGMSVSYSISTTSAQPVALGVSGLPASVTASFSSATAISGHPASLVLSAPAGSQSTPASSITVAGRTASSSHSVGAVLQVAASDFALTVPASAGLAIGGSRSIPVGTTATQGAPETVLLSLAGLPAGVSAQFDPPSVLGGKSSMLILTAAPGAQQGAASLDLGATAPSASHHASLGLFVVAAPTATVTSPGPGAVVSGRVPIGAQATVGAGTTLSSLTFLVDGAPYGSSQSSPANITWDTSAVVSGGHTLTASVQDSVGNQATSAPVQIVVDDGVAPQVSFRSPSAGSVSGMVGVEASATASGHKSIVHVDLLLDGVVVQSGASNDVQLSWDSRSVPNGSHSLSATAVDSAGRAGSQTLTLDVANGAGTGRSGCGSAPGGTAAGLAGLLAFSVLRRRRTGRGATWMVPPRATTNSRTMNKPSPNR